MGQTAAVLRPRGGTVIGLLALYACWGSSIPAMKVMVESVPPLAGTGGVFLLGGLVLAAASRRRARPTRRQAGQAALTGAVLLVGGQGLATVVLTEMTASLVALLMAAIPLWIVVLVALRGDHVAPATRVRLVVGFVGIALVVLTAPGPALGGAAWAVALCLLAAMLWALGSLLAARAAALPTDPIVSAAIQLLAAGLSLVLAAAALGELAPSAWSGVTASSAGAAVFLLLVDSLAGYLLYLRLLATTPPHVVSTYAYVAPVVAVAIGVLALGEPIWAGACLGAAMVIAAVALELRAESSETR